MVGSAIYTDQEILWILEQVLAKTKPADIQSGFSLRFSRDIGPSQIRYVKNKYGKDPRFNPLINRRTAAASSPYLATTPRAGVAGMQYSQATPRVQGLAHPLAGPLPNLGRSQGGLFLPHAGVRRPREEGDDQPGSRPQEAERAPKRRRELPPRQRPILPTTMRPQDEEEDVEEGEEEYQVESHGTSQDAFPAAQEHPSRRARRAYRAANAVPSPFFTATAAAAVAAAAAFPLPRPISRARLSSIPSGNHTPQYYASRAQRTALGKNALPIVPESQAATPFSGGTPVASHFEAYKNRRDAVTSYGRARVIGEASKPAAERSHVPSLDASPASADNGSEMEGDEDAGGSRGNARRLLNKPPIVDLTGDDVDSPSQHLESLYNGGQIAPALPNLSSIGYGYQQLHNMGSNAEYTAYNMLYSNHGPLYANASNVVGLDDFENTQNAHRIGNSYRQAGSDAAFARSTGSRFRRNVNPGTRDFSKPKSDASSGYLQSSTSFREGPVSPRLGGSQGVTNLPNLNRPPGPGFAGGYYSQAMQQRETRVPGACRLQGYEAGPSESVRAMPPPPVPPRVGRPSSRVEAPTCFGPQAEPNALFPEILSQEWLQQQYSEEASGKLLLQFLNEPEYAPFPFDDAPYQAEPATHMRLPHSSPETQGSQAHINPPVSLAAALVQQQQEATISPSVLHTAATLPMAGSDDMQNTGGVLWSFNFQKPPSPGKEENLAMPDAVFGWGTIAPQESLLRPPSQGQLHSGQLIQESENREIGLPKEPFYDVNMHQIDDLFGEGHPWNEISTHFLPSSPGIIGHNPFPTEGGISDAPGEHSLALSADDSLLSYQAGPYGIEYPYAALSSPPHVEPSGEQFSENLSPEQQTVMKLEDPGTS